jgi:outer membrane protein OmpA-like peptidoglycan-associated protein
LVGLVILAVTVAASMALDWWGRTQEPQHAMVAFARGATPAEEADATIDRVAAFLHAHPRHRAVLEGHTGTLGNPQANRDLGEARARAVATALIEDGIDRDRITVLAPGGTDPLPRDEGESEAAWQRRLGRVEITLVPPS